MTQKEFNQWWSDLTTRFPSIAGWFTRLQPVDGVSQPEHQKRVLRTWYDVLQDVLLADALEVSQRMQRGDLEQIGGFDSDKERTPNIIRHHARAISFEREERVRRRSGENFERVHDTFPAGKLLRRIIQLQEKGVPDDEAKATALREFDSVCAVKDQPQ